MLCTFMLNTLCNLHACIFVCLWDVYPEGNSHSVVLIEVDAFACCLCL